MPHYFTWNWQSNYQMSNYLLYNPWKNETEIRNRIYVWQNYLDFAMGLFFCGLLCRMMWRNGLSPYVLQNGTQYREKWTQNTLNMPHAQTIETCSKITADAYVHLQLCYSTCVILKSVASNSLCAITTLYLLFLKFLKLQATVSQCDSYLLRCTVDYYQRLWMIIRLITNPVCVPI